MKKFLIATTMLIFPMTCFGEKSESLGSLLDEIAHINKVTKKNKTLSEENRNRLSEIHPKLKNRPWNEFEAEINSADKMNLEDLLSLGSLTARTPFAWKAFEKFYSSKSEQKSVVALITYLECKKIQSRKYNDSVIVKAEQLANSRKLDIAMVATLNWYVALKSNGQSTDPAIQKSRTIVSKLDKKRSKSDVEEVWGVLLSGLIKANDQNSKSKKDQILMPAYALMSQRFGISLWENAGN